MAKKTKMRKPANTTGLTTDRPDDVQSIENLREMAKAVPGWDVKNALRWLCENKAPLATKELSKKFSQAG